MREIKVRRISPQTVQLDFDAHYKTLLLSPEMALELASVLKDRAAPMQMGWSQVISIQEPTIP